MMPIDEKTKAVYEAVKFQLKLQRREAIRAARRHYDEAIAKAKAEILGSVVK